MRDTQSVPKWCPLIVGAFHMTRDWPFQVTGDDICCDLLSYSPWFVVIKVILKKKVHYDSHYFFIYERAVVPLYFEH